MQNEEEIETEYDLTDRDNHELKQTGVRIICFALQFCDSFS